MKIKTDVGTLCKAYELLDELGVAALMCGGKVELNIADLMRQLLSKQRLIELLEIITGEDCGELEVKDAVEIIKDFFTGLIGGLSGFKELGLKLKPAAVDQKKEIPSGESNTASAESG